MSAPMLTPLVGIITGIIAGSIGAGYFSAAITALSAILIYLMISYCSKDPVKGFVLARLHYIWICILFAAVGMVCYNLSKPYRIETGETDLKAAKGRIENISNTNRGDRLTVEIFELYDKTGSVIKPDNLKIILQTDASGQDIDDIISFPLKIEKIEDSPNHFNKGYARYMADNGLYYKTEARPSEIVNMGHSVTLRGISSKIRDDLESAIEKCPLERRTVNFLITILLGDRAYLDSDTRNLFADAGISHILALSGMHVAIIAGILMWLLFPINLFGYYRQRILIATILLYLYAFITGWSPSTVRATIMMSSMMICLFLERKNSAWNSLLLATFCILAVSPLSLWNIGLQLSFLCVASLIFFVRPLNPIDQHEHPVLYKSAAAVLTTLAATLATWVIVANHFGTVPVVFLPANLLVLPVLPAYLVIAVIFISLNALGLNIQSLSTILDKGLDIIMSLVSYLTDDGDSALMYSPHIFSTILWIVFAGCLALYLNSNKKRVWKWTSAGVFLLFILSSTVKGNALGNGYIIQNNYHELSILNRINGKENQIKIARYQVSEVCIGPHNILVIDNNLANYDNAGTGRIYDVALICGGFKGTLNDLSGKVEAKKIVTHPSLRRKKEKIIIDQADSLSIPIHSIRNNGPLKTMY